jgi:hypothetical protein
VFPPFLLSFIRQCFASRCLCLTSRRLRIALASRRLRVTSHNMTKPSRQEKLITAIRTLQNQLAIATAMEEATKLLLLDDSSSDSDSDIEFLEEIAETISKTRYLVPRKKIAKSTAGIDLVLDVSERDSASEIQRARFSEPEHLTDLGIRATSRIDRTCFDLMHGWSQRRLTCWSRIFPITVLFTTTLSQGRSKCRSIDSCSLPCSDSAIMGTVSV